MFTPIGFYATSGWSFGGVTDSLLVSYEAMGVSDATFTDTSGNGNDGTKSSTSGTGITWTEDGDGNFFTLHAPTSEDTNYVSTGVTPTATKAFSTDIVVQTNNTSGESGIKRWNWWLSAANGSTDRFWTRGNQNSIAIYIDNVEEEKTNVSQIPYNSWFHVCVTWNGSTVTFYVDGTSIGTESNTSTQTWTEGLMLHRDAQRSGVNNFVGTLKMGAVTYYEKALTPSEVTTNYNYFKQYYTGL